MKLFRSLLCVILCFSLAGCAHHKKKNNLWLLLLLAGSRNGAVNPDNNPNNIPTTTPTLPTACKSQDEFGSAPVLTGGSNTIPVKMNLYTFNNLQAFLTGWDFASGNFHLSLTNKTAGRKYFLTAYGIYDKSTGHECDIYFQRWGNTLLPVENFEFTNTGTLSVDGIDNSLPDPAGGFYSFSKTYVQIIVFDSSGKDVTDTDGANVVMNGY